MKAKRRGERFIPFGGNKQTGQRNQALRDRDNQLHELTQDRARLAGKVEQLQLEIACYDKPPIKALAKVMAIPTRDAIRLDIVDPIRDIHQWVDRYAMARLADSIATGKDVPRE